MRAIRSTRPRAASLSVHSRGFLTAAAYKLAQKQLPKMSETEKVALGCGTVGFDRDIFTGSPSLKHLLDTYKPKLSAEEQSFLENEVSELCKMLDDSKVTYHKDFSSEAWDYMRDKGFFGMKIPKEWGGKGFSTMAVSSVLAKLGSHCFDANATVAVPNSLGPGELLVRYGTDAQQKYFLPRLADGTLIPCFGLTGPQSGSDATSLIGSYGIVEKRGDELGVRATFDKRYITLAPVAGVVGIGLELRDPEGLLGGDGGEGFTVALLERGHAGMEMGPRHMPMNSAFMNGTVKGNDVWIPMESILGGQTRCGYGWHMFVECLAEGRGVSLPAGAMGAARAVCSGVGAYTRVRKQFKVPISEFGGIQEAMARAGRESYIILAATELTNAVIDNHEAPMVLSSIMKQSCTERGRRVLENGMDVIAGAGIVGGHANFLGNAYMAMPVAITVEGANIMTRSFQIIGQGLTRCHPHMLNVIEALQSTDKDAPQKFAEHTAKCLKHAVGNFGLSLTRGTGAMLSTYTRSSSAYKDGDKLVAYHEAQMLRLSANFAFASNLCFLLGGRLKFEELLMGRLADAYGAIFLGYATLHHYERNRHTIKGLEPLVESAMLQLEVEAQTAFREAAANFPQPVGALGGWLMSLGCAPLGELFRPYQMPRDSLTKEVAKLLSTPSEVHQMFASNVYLEEGGVTGENRIKELIEAMPVCLEADAVATKCKKEKRAPSEAEAALIARADAVREKLVQVDVHTKVGPLEEMDGYVRPALASTEQRLVRSSAGSFEEALAHAQPLAASA
jgi:alkylation response protein AidB-like acyl-CoA dehydrogenase